VRLLVQSLEHPAFGVVVAGEVVGLQRVGILADLPERREHRHHEHADDDRERSEGADLGHVQAGFVHGVQEQLHADEPQDRGQPVGEVDEPVEQSVEQEEHRSQSHEGERVGGEHDVGLAGQSEDRRDGVQGEQQVGHEDRDHHDEQRRRHAPAVDSGEEVAVVVLAGGGDDLLGESHDLVVGWVPLRAVVGDELDRRVDEEAAEEVEQPGVRGQRGGADEDEDQPQDQGHHDADHQHLLLVQLRDGE